MSTYSLGRSSALKIIGTAVCAAGRYWAAPRRRRLQGRVLRSSCHDHLERAHINGTNHDDVIVAGSRLTADRRRRRPRPGLRRWRQRQRRRRRGRDRIDGDKGDDHLSGGKDADLITGNRGDDLILGGANSGDAPTSSPAGPATTCRRRLRRDDLADGPGSDVVRGDAGDDLHQPPGRSHGGPVPRRQRSRQDR